MGMDDQPERTFFLRAWERAVENAANAKVIIAGLGLRLSVFGRSKERRHQQRERGQNVQVAGPILCQVRECVASLHVKPAPP